VSDPGAEPIRIGAKATESVTCAECQQSTPPGQYYSYKDQQGQDVFLCSACRDKVEKVLAAENENPNLPLAVIAGLAGALVAGIVWYLIVTISGYEIGYVAIGVGWLIGWAVHLGSGRRRGVPLQLLSAAITLCTLVVASYFTFLHFVRKAMLEEKVEGYAGEFFLISPFEPTFLQNLVSPIGLLIWAIALYVAFSVTKPRSL
jgi:hypothetical protein